MAAVAMEVAWAAAVAAVAVAVVAAAVHVAPVSPTVVAARPGCDAEAST